MSDLKVNFLNFRPDLEDTENDGLTVAQNVVHEPEGYKAVYLASTGTLSTTGGLASVTSIVTKAIGVGDDTLSAWLSADTLHVGINGVTMTSTSTGFPVSFSTATTFGSPEITFFDTCELNGLVFFSAQASMSKQSPNTVTSIAVTGYSTIVSV